MDTNVVVAALRSRLGSSFRLLELWRSRHFSVCASTPLFLEYESALKRPEQMVEHGLTTGEIDSILDGWAAMLVPVNLSFLWRPQLKDPKDEMVLETAINGRCQGIVTFNSDEFETAARAFGIRIWRPAEFLRRIMRSTA